MTRQDMFVQTTHDILGLDLKQVEKEIESFIKKVVKDAGASGVVVGMSGGIDSSVVAALSVRALGKEGVFGILMPASHTPKQDLTDASELAARLGIKTYEVHIDEIFNSFVSSIPLKGNRIADANIKARIRMTICYYYANSLNMLVAGTGDRSEDLIGYFTKYGDGGVDFLPIAHLYKTQVRNLGAYLRLPEKIVAKPSSPQLWPGHMATDEIPADYNKLDLILHGLFDEKLPPEEVAKKTNTDFSVVNEVMKRHLASSHKRNYPLMVRSW